MKRLRIGKDFGLSWKIKAKKAGENAPYTPSSDSLLLLVTPYNKVKAEGATFDGDTVRWIFRGKDQKHPGIYGLELVENQGKNGMITIDTCKGFELVEHTCEETGQDGESLIFDTLEFITDVELNALRGPQGEPGPEGPQGPAGPEGPQGPAGPSGYDDAELRERIAELEAENEAMRTEIESQNELIEDLQNTKIDKEADDYYPQLSVGVADNLAGVDEVASDFNFRQSGGGAIADGSARVVSIKGNSVVWNQHFERGAVRTDAGASQYYDEATGEMVINGTITTGTQYSGSTAYGGKYSELVTGHKYLTIIRKTSGTYSGTTSYIYLAGSGRLLLYTGATEQIQIWEAKSGNLPFSIITFQVGDTFDNLRYKIRNYDLTQMFCPGYEPTTLAEFYRRIPEGIDLDAYNPGQIVDMKATGILSTSANVWDEQWEAGSISATTGENTEKTGFIRSTNLITLGIGATYHNSSPYRLYLRFYDSAQQFIMHSEAQPKQLIPKIEDAKYFRFSVELSEYKNDICINLSYSETNSKYFPHIEAREDLSIVRKYFPDGMKSAGSAHDEIRNNKASGKWEYSKGRMKAVDMGSLTFSEWQDGLYAANLADMAIKGQILCAKYSTYTYTNVTAKNTGIAALTDKGGIVIYDATYTTPSAIKTALQGVILYYEAAEWEWETIKETDFNTDYKVWNGGTEQMIADGPSSALRADITYGFNATGLLKQIKAALVTAGLL